MPLSCELWNCRWLTGDKTENMSRPDRAGYVIDVMPDFIEVMDNETGERTAVPVVQVWIDPARPEQWRDDNDFFSYIKRMAEDERMAAIIRHGSALATVIIAPCMSQNGEWHMTSAGLATETHTPADIMQAGFNMVFHSSDE